VRVQALPVLHENKIAFVITFKDFVRFILENYQEADIPNKKGSVASKISTWIRGILFYLQIFVVVIFFILFIFIFLKKKNKKK